MAVKVKARTVFKILGIVLASFVGGMALILSIAYIAGAFEPQVVKPKDISFAESNQNITISRAYDLTINTSTEGVTDKRVSLSLEAGQENVLTIPTYAYIGEPFYVYPKQINGSNAGGVAKIRASADSGRLWAAPLTVYVDVEATGLSFNVFSENNFATIDYRPMSFFSSKLAVAPANAMNPGHLDVPTSDPAINAFNREKTIYYFMVDSGIGENLADANANLAWFTTGSSSKLNAINSNQIKANSASKAEWGNTQGSFFVQAVMFKTFADNDAYSNLTNSQVFEMFKDTSDKFVVTPVKYFGVQDVEVAGIVSSAGVLPLYIHENGTALANNAAPNTVNLAITLQKPLTDIMHTEADLYKFLQYVTLSEKDTNYLQISKVGGTTGINTAFNIMVNSFDKEQLLAGTAVTLVASFEKFDGSETFTVEISAKLIARPLNELHPMTVNYSGSNYFTVDGSFGTSALNMGAITGGSYNHVTINPLAGSSTFNKIMFYLDPLSLIYKPLDAGKYKVTFEFVKQAGVTVQVGENTSYLGDINATLAFYSLNTDGTINQQVININSLSGRFLATFEVNKNTGEFTPSLKFNSEDVTSTAIKNLQFYEETSIGSGVYKEYPYLKVYDSTPGASELITLYCKVNTTTGLIDNAYGTLMAKGYGEFDVYARIIATDINGGFIRNDYGDYYIYASERSRVVVSNSIQDLDLFITDDLGVKIEPDSVTGVTTLLEGSDVYGAKEYYLVISTKDTNTPFGVLYQALTYNNLLINPSYATYINSVLIGSDRNGTALTLSPTPSEYFDADNTTRIGYKFLLTVGNTYSVEYQSTESFAKYNIVFSGNYADTLSIEIQDIVIESTDFGFVQGGSFVPDVLHHKTVAATDVDGAGKIIYKEATVSAGIVTITSNVIDILNSLQYQFNYKNGIDALGVTVNPNFSVTSGAEFVSLTGNRIDIKNVPYDAGSGYYISITVSPVGSNGRYVYTTPSTSSWLTYSDTVKTYSFTVYGFDISVTPISLTPLAGTQGSAYNILSVLSFNVLQGDGVTSTTVGSTAAKLSSIIGFRTPAPAQFELNSSALTISILQDLGQDTNFMLQMFLGNTTPLAGTPNVIIPFTSPYSVENNFMGNISIPVTQELGTKIRLKKGASYLTTEYSLDQNELTYLGIANAVSINNSGELVVSNFAGTHTITIIATGIIAGVGDLPPATITRYVTITLASIWSPDDVTLSGNTTVEVEASAGYESDITAIKKLNIALHGQTLSNVSVSVQNPLTSPNNKVAVYAYNDSISLASGLVVGVKAYEHHEPFNVTLLITLTFSDNSSLTINKLITIVPYLKGFEVAGTLSGGNTLTLALNEDGVDNNVYLLTDNTLQQKAILRNYLERSTTAYAIGNITDFNYNGSSFQLSNGILTVNKLNLQGLNPLESAVVLPIVITVVVDSNSGLTVTYNIDVTISLV